jgi:proteasome lid subunit RPN8/RPN11
MIRISSQVEQAISADGRQTYPDECCGFLFGTETDGVRLISDILVVDNSKAGDKRRRFEISAKDYLKAERFAVEHDLELLGIYHSHPDHPAIPSEHDRVAAQPFFSYVIISIVLGQPAGIRSWRLNDAFQFEEELVHVPLSTPYHSSLISHH